MMPDTFDRYRFEPNSLPFYRLSIKIVAPSVTPQFVTVTKDVTSDVLLEISLMQKFCNDIVIDEDKVCCMCGTTKFIGHINTGEKYYCNACMKKINDSGMDYWKPCTQVEFFESMLSHMRKGKNKKSTNMLSGLKEQFEKFEKEEAKDEDKV